MRKEVIYSLAALSLAPVAANAGVNGEVIPGYVTGNNWENDIDGKADNGEVKWVSGSVKFTISQKLVPGDYTFTAQLHNPGIGVVFEIPSLNVKYTKNAQDPAVNANESQEVAVKFTVTEETTGLEIVVHGVTDFQEGSMQNFLLSFAKQNDVLTQGLEFNQSNFKNQDGTWKQPLAGINNAIDNYVNNTLTYESDEAKKVMTAEKEKIQKSTTDDHLTYEFYMDNQIYDPTVETNPLYKEATEVYNKATRIEAEYQADKIKKLVDDYLEGTKDLDDKNQPTGDPDATAQMFADKVLSKITDYKETADDKTGSEWDATKKEFTDGNDTPVVLNSEFDVDPTASPLREILADAKALTDKTNNQTAADAYAGQVVDLFSATYDAIEAAKEDINAMYGDGKSANVQGESMAVKFSEKAAELKANALDIIGKYEAQVNAFRTAAVAEDIADIDAALVSKIQTAMTAFQNAVANNATGDTYIKSYYDLFNDYTQKLAAATTASVNILELDELGKKYFENDATYTAWKTKIEAAKTAALAGFSVSNIKLVSTADTQAEEKIVSKKANVYETENANFNGKILGKVDTSKDQITSAASVNDKLIADYNAFITGLNELAKAKDALDKVNELIEKEYEKYEVDLTEYDNRKFYKGNFKLSDLAKADFAKKDVQKTFAAFYAEMKDSLDAAINKSEVTGADNKVSYNELAKNFVTAANFLQDITDFIAAVNEKGHTYNYYYQDRGLTNPQKYAFVTDAFADLEARIQKLVNKLSPLSIYTAKFQLYKDAAISYTDDNKTEQTTYDHPGVEGTDITNAKTYKQFIISLQDQLAAWKKDFAKLTVESATNFDTREQGQDNHTTILNDAIAALTAFGYAEAENNETHLKEPKCEVGQILRYVDEWVKKDGVIDQQMQKLADMIPQDNFEQLMAHIGPEDGTAALGTLKKRLEADKNAETDAAAYKEEKDGKVVYKVGVDTDLDSSTPLVGTSIKQLVAVKKGYDGELLTNGRLAEINAICEAYENKFNEAKGIYAKYAAASTSETYDEAGAADYNESLTGAIHTTTEKTPEILNCSQDQANDYNEANNLTAGDAGYKSAGDDIPATYYTQEEVNAYNALLDGAKKAGDVKVASESTSWKKEDYEKANGELGVAIAIINELNTKLYDELEPAIMAEAEAQFKHKAILDQILTLELADGKNGSDVTYQAGLVTYLPKTNSAGWVWYNKWWNGKKGVSKKVMDPNALYYLIKFNGLLNTGGDIYVADAERSAEQKALFDKMSTDDQQKYTQFKTLFGRIMDLYKALDQAYLDNDFSAWNLKKKSGDATAVNFEINNATLNQIEADIKTFVDGCVAGTEAFQDTYEALFNLMTLSNIDENDDDENYDWFNLIKEDQDINLAALLSGGFWEGNNLNFIEFINGMNTRIMPAGGWQNLDVAKATPEQKAWLLAIYYTLFDGEFEVADLLATTGIKAIEKNDKNAETIEDFLEPVQPVKDADGNITGYMNLHTFHNQLAAADKQTEPTEIKFEDAAGSRTLIINEEGSTTIIEGVNPEHELYDDVSEFLADIQAAIDNRTLGEDYLEMKNRLKTLIDNVLNIDKHAAQNKAQHDLMSDELIPALQATIDEQAARLPGMGEGTPKNNFKNTLDRAQALVDALQNTVDQDYEDGHAWQEEYQLDEQRLLDLAKAAVAEVLGGVNDDILADNATAFGEFEQLYKDANQEHTDLVAKLEQLKNLNANAVKAGYDVDGAEAKAQEINDFLFGKVGENDDATETAKDKLDKAYKEGTDAKNAAETANPVKAWAEVDFKKRITDVKSKIEGYIDAVDRLVEGAFALLPSLNTALIEPAAEFAMEHYQTHQAARVTVANTPDNEDTEEVNEKEEAKKAEIKKIIEANSYWSGLYSTTNQMADKIKAYRDAKKTVGGHTYQANTFYKLNDLFDAIVNLNEAQQNGDVQEGLNEEAAKDVKLYTDKATAHLAEDKADLLRLGFALDEKIEGAGDETFEKILKDYDAIVKDKDGKPVKVIGGPNGNHDDIVEGIIDIIGDPFVNVKDENGNETTTNRWWKNGRCEFIHTLVQNDKQVNKDANQFALNELQKKLDAAKNYIKGYQVAANVEIVTEIQKLQDLIDLAKKLSQDEDFIKSANSISAQIQQLVYLFGHAVTLDTKKQADYAGADGKLGTEDDILGGMDAEDGFVEDLVNNAWELEKKALEQDINEMRAAVKELDTTPAYTDEQIKAYSDKVEALWKKVEAAKIEEVYDETPELDEDGKPTENMLQDWNSWSRTYLAALQAEVLPLYKELRGLTLASQPVSGLAANWNGRLYAIISHPVADAYAAGAPNVQKIQSVLTALVTDAQNTLNASLADGSTDFFREKLENMVQNAENLMNSRDKAAAVWTDRKAKADELLAKLDASNAEVEDLVEKSKKAVNAWVNNDKLYPAGELYNNLTDSQSALYEVAGQKMQALLEAAQAVVNPELDENGKPIRGTGYKLDKNGNYDFLGSEDVMEAQKALKDALDAAENACADFDLNKRIDEITKALDELKNIAANGVYDDNYLQSKGVCSKDADGNIVWGWKVNQLESRIASLIALVNDQKNLTTTDLDGTSSQYAYENLRKLIEQWILDDPDTEEDDTELIHGIQYRLDELSEILGNNVLGDVTGDGRVTLLDVYEIVKMVMNPASQPKPGDDKFKRADVNQDGLIDITDASCAVNIYFYGNPEGINNWTPAEARTANAEAVSVTATKTAEGLTRLAINLDNAQQFTAFQMALQLADGMKLMSASLSDRAGQQFLQTSENDGVLTIAAMSVTNAAISGNSGAVLYLDFEVAEGAEDNFARFQDVFFVTRNAQKVSFNLGGITPTGIQSANAETALGQKFYDLGGRMKSSLKKGVNIIRDAAGNAKKVLVK